MISYYAYVSYKFPFTVPYLNIGIYAKGHYYHIEGYEYLTQWTKELAAALIQLKARREHGL